MPSSCIVRNTLAGLEGVDARTVEAAQGMGMSDWQRLWQVELPLASPVILAGIRIATVATIGIGTIAAFINAGGLGVLLFEGVRTSNYDKIVAGAHRRLAAGDRDQLGAARRRTPRGAAGERCLNRSI